MALTHSSVYSISPGTSCLGKLCNICFHNSVLASSKDKHKGPVQTKLTIQLFSLYLYNLESKEVLT